MLSKEFNIILDLKKHKKVEFMEFVQGDINSNVISIKLEAGGQDYNLEGTKVEIIFSKPDGTTVMQSDIDILNAEEGRIRCVLKTNTISAVGVVKAEVKIRSEEDDKLLTSTLFRIHVRESLLQDETIESSNEYGVLLDLIKEVEELLREAEEANITELAEMKEELILLKQELLDLKETLLKDDEKREQLYKDMLDLKHQLEELKETLENSIPFINDKGNWQVLDKDTGVQAQGETGKPLNIIGTLESESELPSDAKIGDAYIINKTMYVLTQQGWKEYGGGLVSSVNGKVGEVVLTGKDIDYSSSKEGTISDTIDIINTEIDNLKLSGIERNKELVANLNSKRVSATTEDSLKTNIERVNEIKLGSGNAKPEHVLKPYTFSSNDGTDLVGTMDNNGIINKTFTKQGEAINIPSGYVENGKIDVDIENLISRNIIYGVEVGGIKGTAKPSKYYKEITIKPPQSGTFHTEIVEVPGIILMGTVSGGDVNEQGEKWCIHDIETGEFTGSNHHLDKVTVIDNNKLEIKTYDYKENFLTIIDLIIFKKEE